MSGTYGTPLPPTSLTMVYATGALQPQGRAYGPNPTQFGNAEPSPPPMASTKSQWKDYMRSLGTNFSELDIMDERDKPLPPIPHQHQYASGPPVSFLAQPLGPPRPPNSAIAAAQWPDPYAPVTPSLLIPLTQKPAGATQNLLAQPPPLPAPQLPVGQGPAAPYSAYAPGSTCSAPPPRPPPVPPRPQRLSLPSSSTTTASALTSTSGSGSTASPLNAHLWTHPPSATKQTKPTSTIVVAASGNGGDKSDSPSKAGRGCSVSGSVPTSLTKRPSTTTKNGPTGRPSSASSRAAHTPVIDLTGDSDSDASYTPSSDSEPDGDVTAPSRSTRAKSAQPRLQRITPAFPLRTAGTSPGRSRTPPPLPGARASTGASHLCTPNSSANILKSPQAKAKGKGKAAAPAPAPASAPASPAASTAVQCAGFTRAGAPCKRLVKAAAPFALHQGATSSASADDVDADTENLVGRYCKDHAGLVCAAAGFYWRDARGKAGVWIQFDDYIPSDLGQQTQTLLRMTMESPLTAKEQPGFLYAYELRSLATSSSSYFKVGRTDNVPRRIGQWSNQCKSHTPTLRDIFPLKAPSPRTATSTGAAGLQRRQSALGSLLPGAVNGDVDGHRMVPAVKRWERLVHLELADRSATLCTEEYDALAAPCADCGAIHKEIFPLLDGSAGGGATGVGAYENIVVDAISRWEEFIRAICNCENMGTSRVA